MRPLTIQAPPLLAEAFTRWLAHLVLDIPTGPGVPGYNFDGGQAGGTVVAQRRPGVWTVSFRTSPGGDIGYYTDPHVVAQVIIAGEHDEAARIPRPANERGGEDVTAEVLAASHG